MNKLTKLAGLAGIMSLLLMPTLLFAQTGANLQNHDNGLKNGLQSTKTTTLKQKTLTGTVNSISDPNVVFAAKDGTTYTADTSGAKIIRRFGATMQISDIQIGDSITVRGTITDTNVKATLIRDMSLQAYNVTFAGKVKTIDGTTDFTMQTVARGLQTVNLDSSTVFKKNGKDATLSDLAVGSNVIVTGVWNRTNNNIAAKKVNIIVRILPIYFQGTLSSKSDTTLTIQANSNTNYDVDITKARLVRKYGGKTTVAEFNIGDKIQVIGKHVSGSTDVTASLVRDISITAKSSTNANQTSGNSNGTEGTGGTSATPTPTSTPTPSPVQ